MTIRSRLEAGAVRASRALIARACQPLPDAERDERYREWVAELPAIPECHRFWPAGLLAMLFFAADQFRTTRPARRLARVAAGQQARKARSTRHRVGAFDVVGVVSNVGALVSAVVSVLIALNGISALNGVGIVFGVGVGVSTVVGRLRERSRRHAASGTGTGPGVSGRRQ